MSKEEAYELLYDYIFNNYSGEDREVCLRALDVLSGGEDTYSFEDDV